MTHMDLCTATATAPWACICADIRHVVGAPKPCCSCGKPFPEDGGAEGVCECCSGCEVAS